MAPVVIESGLLRPPPRVPKFSAPPVPATVDCNVRAPVIMSPVPTNVIVPALPVAAPRELTLMAPVVTVSLFTLVMLTAPPTTVAAPGPNPVAEMAPVVRVLAAEIVTSPPVPPAIPAMVLMDPNALGVAAELSAILILPPFPVLPATCPA